LPDECIAELREAARLDSDSGLGHNSLGSVLADQGKLEEGIAEFRKAIRFEPDLACAHANLGRALTVTGSLDEGIAELREAIRLDSTSAQAHNNLGRALSAQGKLNEAIVEFRESVRLDSGYGPDFAWLLATCPDPKLRRPEEALDLAKQSVKSLPNEPAVWKMLGVAFYRTGQWQEATEALRKSVELSSGDNPCEWLFVAMAQWQLGEKDQARRSYEKAVAVIRQGEADDELSRFRAEANALLGMSEARGVK
jgi:tetratricopeptide (TPR) repeat protein